MANPTSHEDSYLLEEQHAEDTEITLGTGKMLFLFFALVALCAVFFGMGFKVGRNSVKEESDNSPTGTANVTSSAQTSGAKPSATPDMSFYKAVEQNNPNPQLAPAMNATQPGATGTAPASSTTGTSSAASSGSQSAASAPPLAPVTPGPDQLSNTNGYLVQVAAVTKQEDADALVDALKKKQYPAFAAANPVDKLVHVQVGPFSDIKQAEDMRTKLINDGYNPILKK
jgi:DedD protein